MKTVITLERMKGNFTDGRQIGSIAIGHGGKLHPASVDPVYGLTVHCHCPGTQNGSALNKSGFHANVEPTCGNR